MRALLTILLLSTSFFLSGQVFFDFESGTQGWTTGDNHTTHLGAPSRSSTWRLATQTGGTTPFILGDTWYGTPNTGQLGAERSWIISPALYADETTVSVTFDSYTANEGGFLYDRERIQLSINGGTYIHLHGYDVQLHRHADRTVRNITYSANVAIGDELRFRFLYDTGDGIIGGISRNILGWYVDNIHIKGVDPCSSFDVNLSISDPVLYFGYGPASCTTAEVSTTRAHGEVTYYWSINNDESNSGDFASICAEGPECIMVKVYAVDEQGCTATARMLVNVVDVSCPTFDNTPKVRICQNPGTADMEMLCVDAASVPDYLANGAVLGGCTTNSSCSQALVQAYDDAQLNEAQARERTQSLSAANSVVPSFDLSTIAIEDKRVHIYPNPASVMTNVKFHQAIEGPVGMEVYNQLGQLVLTTTMNVSGGEAASLNVSALPPGIYKLLVRLENNALHTEQLVVMK